MAAKTILTCELFQDFSGQWRWRLRRPNGKLVATAGESFYSKGNAKRSWVNFRLGMSNWTVKIVEIPLTEDQKANLAKASGVEEEFEDTIDA